ncbi:hypothetical protein WQ57_10550 [Mesobacillus campisalis]|uniref:Uncharacterized protein n=1 Tax=Mesobacillus campisalis TaxID=1408103 RepID=A0A0M2SUG5_9BACI|nr:hypothetical protein [Mesobacillus campisalis]KKK38229.1 hypothetical protein WQ57_10550 [Mesobacillus campisalis]
MTKKIVIAVFCTGFVLVISFFALRPTEPAGTIIPDLSLEERVCERVTAQFGDCKRILLYDSYSKLVFAESSSGIIPVLTNKEFTDFKKFISPMMDFQEFKEERVERGPVDWRADNQVEGDFSVLYGFAEDEAKTIVLTSEGHVQPNRFFVRDNLWVWYAVLKKDEVEMPVKVTVYDGNGKMIYGE